MPTTLHLMGGGPGGLLSVRRHFRAALELTRRPSPLVAYVGAASGDSGVFFAMVRTALHTGGLRMRQAKTVSSRASAAEARGLLHECDLVFVSGGDVELGMKALLDKDMVAPLQALAADGKPMVGISAGSIMLARDWVRFSGDDAESAELFGCLGIAPIHVDAHAEADDWDELRALVALLHRGGDSGALGYGLTRKGGLRVELGVNGVNLEALGTPIPRIGVRDERVIDLDPLPL